jgi:hypothetical protein
MGAMAEHVLNWKFSSLGPPEVEDMGGQGSHSSGPLIYDPNYHRVWVGGPFTHHGEMIEHIVGAPTEFPHHEYPEYEYGQRRGDKATWYSPGFEGEEDVNQHLGIEPVDYDQWDFHSKVAAQGSAGHQLNWDLGRPGKGMLDPEGNVHTWTTEGQDGTPSHAQYAEQVFDLKHPQGLVDEVNWKGYDPHGGEWEGQPTSFWDTAFNISRAGRVKFYKPRPEQYGENDPRDYRRIVEEADPRFKDVGFHGKEQWHFGNSTGTWHHNLWTGERCNCPWNDAHAKLTKLGGPNLNKVLKAPDKALRTPEGEEFKRIMVERLGEERESLAPYLAHRFKKGDIRVGGDRDLPEGTVGGPHLQFWQGGNSYERWLKDWKQKKQEVDDGEREQEEKNRAFREFQKGRDEEPEDWSPVPEGERPYSDKAKANLEDCYFNPLDHVLPNWHNWYEARQHPLRRGVNVLEGDWTPQKMNERARAHSEEVRREKQTEELSHAGKVVHKFEPHKGGVGIDWDQVAENEDQYRTGLGRHEVEQAEREGKGDTDPELRSLRDMYPKTVAPRKSGWHIKQLQDAEDLRAEGTMMGHCIGNDEKYGNALEHGLIDAYSLRDPKGRPHLTWHYNSDGSLAELFGPNDDDPKPEYQAMLDEWGEQTNRPTKRADAVGHQEEDPEEDRELPYANFPQAEDVSDYIQYHHPDGRYQEVEHVDIEGREPGENTEYNWEEPEWTGVSADYADQYKHVYHAPEGQDPVRSRQQQEFHDRRFDQQQQEFLEAIKHHGHQSEMTDALQNHINETYGENGELMEPGEQPDNDHVRNIQRWNETFPSWEVNIPQAPPEEGYLGPYHREPPQPGIVWPHTPHLYDPQNTWKIGPGGTGQQQMFSFTGIAKNDEKWQLKTAMPVDESFWHNWQKGPKSALYHGTTPARLESIMRNGLHPWDSDVAGGTNYGKPNPNEFGKTTPDEWLIPRPGHVYMAQYPMDARDRSIDDVDRRADPPEEPIVLKINPAHLDPQHINPDEDNMIPEATISPQEGYDSLGQMADAMGYGDVPGETERQVAQGNHIGYRGVIPPEALTPGVMRAGAWEPLEAHQFTAGATPAPWEPGQWGKGIYYPDTDHLVTWADERTHGDVWGDDENAAQPGPAHHLIIRPNGTVRDQGAMDRNYENAESSTPELAAALRAYDQRLKLDSSEGWDFANTEPQRTEPDSLDESRYHNVQFQNDVPGL